MNNKSRFGKLIGVLDVTNSYCKFLVSEIFQFPANFKVESPMFTIYLNFLHQVYAVKNREILTCHEISIGRIESSDEEEYDPIELWNAVKEVNSTY